MSRSGWIAVAVVFVVAVGLVFVGTLYRSIRPRVVPDVRLQSVGEAASMLATAELKLGSQGQVATDAVGPGFVAEQSPGPQSTAKRESAVDVTVAVAPVGVEVPDLHGLAVDEAVKTLSDALFAVQVVDIFNADRAPGTVVQQSPASGSQWITGRPVAIAVVVGPDDGTAVAVPKVKGYSPSKAYAALENAGLFGAGFVTQPSAIEESVVAKQLPGKGILVRPGTTVLLLFDEPK